MTIKINAQGANRKELAKEVSNWLGYPLTYAGAPTFAYHVGNYTIAKDGSLSFDGDVDNDVLERLLEHLYDYGFDIDQSSTEDDEHGIAIQIPESEMDENAINNLKHILVAKGKLIKKALGVKELPINHIDGRLDFPWFPSTTSPEDLKAYMHFVVALCDMARKQKRITAKEKDLDNEKYAFRCFLLRLGFVGTEYKAERKVLLRNLSGSAAFKNGSKKEDTDNV